MKIEFELRDLMASNMKAVDLYYSRVSWYYQGLFMAEMLKNKEVKEKVYLSNMSDDIEKLMSRLSFLRSGIVNRLNEIDEVP